MSKLKSMSFHGFIRVVMSQGTLGPQNPGRQVNIENHNQNILLTSEDAAATDYHEDLHSN